MFNLRENMKLKTGRSIPDPLPDLRRRIEDLTDALDSFVQCVETIKHDRQHDGTTPDWFDWAFINQELKKSKKVLGGGE